LFRMGGWQLSLASGMQAIQRTIGRADRTACELIVAVTGWWTDCV
jgi:hypothetical protein